MPVECEPLMVVLRRGADTFLRTGHWVILVDFLFQDLPAYISIEFADKGLRFGDGHELGCAHPTVRFSVIADRFGLDRCDQPDPIFFQRFGIWVLKLLAKVGHFDVAYPIPKHHIAVLDKFTELLGALAVLIVA